MLSMIYLDVTTADDVCEHISSQLKALRKAKGLTQAELAEKSGVSLGSVKRFERTGQISLISLSKIAIVLKVEAEMMELFNKKHYSSIEEVIAENA